MCVSKEETKMINMKRNFKNENEKKVYMIYYIGNPYNDELFDEVVYENKEDAEEVIKKAIEKDPEKYNNLLQIEEFVMKEKDKEFHVQLTKEEYDIALNGKGGKDK